MNSTQASSWEAEASPLLEGTPISVHDLVSPEQGEESDVWAQQVPSHWTLPGPQFLACHSSHAVGWYFLHPFTHTKVQMSSCFKKKSGALATLSPSITGQQPAGAEASAP